MRKSHFNDEFLVLLGPIFSRLFTCSNAEKMGACSSPISMILPYFLANVPAQPCSIPSPKTCLRVYKNIQNCWGISKLTRWIHRQKISKAFIAKSGNTFGRMANFLLANPLDYLYSFVDGYTIHQQIYWVMEMEQRT
jgi:hypothetical protein